MVQVTQTEDEIKIVIELNRLITRKPDIVLLPLYIKYNSPPIFFERHLQHEIDEIASFCRIFKNEARLILVKKQKGMWPEIFQQFSKDELFKKRLEISDQIVERNKERDKQAVERYHTKRRQEIEKELKRENAIHERVEEFKKNACQTLIVGNKETHPKPIAETRPNVNNNNNNKANTTTNNNNINTNTNNKRLCTSSASLRDCGNINFTFSNFTAQTPKRESQAGITYPATSPEQSEIN